MNMGGNQFRCVAKVYYKWAIKVQNSNNPYKYRFVETYEIINIDYNIDKDGIIIIGTPNYCRDLDSVIDNQIAGDNLLYAFHFYNRRWRKYRLQS